MALWEYRETKANRVILAQRVHRGNLGAQGHLEVREDLEQKENW